MPKVDPYSKPLVFTEGEVVTKESFTGLADNIAGADGAIDENNIRQEGLDGRNFYSGNIVENIDPYQIRTKSASMISVPNNGVGSGWKKVPQTSALRGTSGTAKRNVDLRFTFKPEFNTHAIIRCSGAISTRPNYVDTGSEELSLVSGFYIPENYVIDIGLLIRGVKETDLTSDSTRFDIDFNRDDPEASYHSGSSDRAKVWPYQRICLNPAYTHLAQEGYRKNVTDWRGYDLDDFGRIEDPETAVDSATGGIIIPEQGNATEWLYDRKSYMYYNFNLLAHISSEYNSGFSFLVNDSYATGTPDTTEPKDFIVDLVYRTSMSSDDLKGHTKDIFERDAGPTAKHLDPKLSSLSNFDAFRIENLTMNVQIINR